MEHAMTGSNNLSRNFPGQCPECHSKNIELLSSPPSGDGAGSNPLSGLLSSLRSRIAGKMTGGMPGGRRYIRCRDCGHTSLIAIN